MDILGPLPKTKQGFQYILLIVDSFSKWSEAFPLVTVEANEIANILVKEYFSRYGAPRVIVSDRGRNFMSKLIKAICELFQVKRHYTSSYHPQTNATCERANSTLAKVLRAYVNENQSNWAQLVPFAMMAFRSTPATESTGYSPYHLLFGKEMNLPIDVSLIPKPNIPKQTEQYLKELVHNLQTSKNIAKENQTIAGQKLRHDVKAKTPDFRVTDIVLKKNNFQKPGQSAKLTKKWIGPYKIVTEGPNCTYKLKHCETNETEKALVNSSRLKHYQESFSDSEDEQDINNEHTGTQSNNVQQNYHSTHTPNTKMLQTPCPKSSQSNTKNDDKVGPETKDSSVPSKGNIVRILRTCINCNKRLFFVELSNGHRTWVFDTDVDEDLVQSYWKTHTKVGKRRKKRTKHVFFQPKTE